MSCEGAYDAGGYVVGYEKLTEWLVVCNSKCIYAGLGIRAVEVRLHVQPIGSNQKYW